MGDVLDNQTVLSYQEMDRKQAMIRMDNIMREEMGKYIEELDEIVKLMEKNYYG